MRLKKKLSIATLPRGFIFFTLDNYICGNQNASWNDASENCKSAKSQLLPGIPNYGSTKCHDGGSWIGVKYQLSFSRGNVSGTVKIVV